jgi:genome maintenance exonuclease 1
MRKTFKHLDIGLGYDDLTTKQHNRTRLYECPDGKLYPSVTTVLSMLSKEAIEKWRKKVGKEKADRISYRASQRGTAVHEIIEKYIKNDDSYTTGVLPNILDNFKSVQKIINTKIDNVVCQEGALYSDHLGLAGRVDCVAEWDGVMSIIDFKTSSKSKKRTWCESYFIQEAAYAIMYEERTGIPVSQLVTLIAVDEKPPQVFIEKRDMWSARLIEVVSDYNKSMNGLIS